MCIDRCVCHDVHFDTLLAVAHRSNVRRLEALQQEIPFGRNCRRCHPYVRRMLETGETSFSEIIGEDDGGEAPSTKPVT